MCKGLDIKLFTSDIVHADYVLILHKSKIRKPYTWVKLGHIYYVRRETMKKGKGVQEPPRPLVG